MPVPEHLEPIWNRVRDELRREVPDFKFHIWLDPLELVAADARTLHVRAPDHIRTWVQDRYLPVLRAAAERALDGAPTVRIVDGDWSVHTEPPSVSPPGASALNLRPKYTFEQFVIGRGNRTAHGAALKVAEVPGQAFNPLFIHGRPGLGKTHLLHAIGNYVTRFGSGLKVRYATVEDFTSEFVLAVRSNDMDRFKRSFRGVDVLLLDDVQFLADKSRTEEELFHTFNFLHDSGRQLVMSSDRAPSALQGLQQRLGERFASGLVVTLEAPELRVRRAILEKRARLDSVDATPALLDEIAARVTTSVRALEAALIQVVAYASLRDETPTPELARNLLERIQPHPPTTTSTIERICDATATHFGVEPRRLIARDRRPAVARARKVAMYLSRELTNKSLPEIGRDFGDRDHTTVLSAVRTLSREVLDDPHLAQAVQSLRESLVAQP